MKINGSLRFDASALSQIENLRVEKLSALPTWTSNDIGRLVYITGTQIVWVGGASAWIAIATGGNASALQTEVDAIETTLGAAIGADGTFNAGGFTLPGAAGTPTSFTDAINKLGAYASGADMLSELGDVTITTPANGDLIIYNTSATKWQNKAVGTASGVQAYSAILAGVTALAAGTGLVVKTGASSFANRSVVAPAAGITITNGDGIAGNPTLVLANDLAALEGLSTTGYIVRTADGTATTRSIAGTASNIVVTNGSGVASDTSINLATVTQAGTGNFVKVTLDTFGRVTGNTSVVAADITALIDATYVNVTGDTMSGSLTFSSGTVTGLPNPTNASDAANKAYVDALQQGLAWKNAVRVGSTANITVASPGATIDGVTMAVGNRVLLKDQTTTSQNGIYIWNGAAVPMTRSPDMDAAAEFDGAAVFVQEGTVNQGSGYTETLTVAAVGTDAVSFSQFSGGATYVWGTGLSSSGNTINVNLGAGIFEGPTDEVGIDLYTTSAGGLILTTDGTTRAATTGTKLHILTDGTSGLAQAARGLYISAAGVTNAMLTNSTVGLNGDAGSSTLALGQTLQVIGSSTQGISTSVSGQTVTITATNASTTQKGVASFNTNAFTVAAGVVSLAATLDDITNVSGSDAAATGSLFQKTATTWQPVSVATVAGTINLETLANVDSAVGANGTALIKNSSGVWAAVKTYHLYTSSAAATTHTVTHGIGQKYCTVTVVDSTDNVVIPESIVFNSTTQLTVTFNASIDCKVVVMGVPSF